ncbi:MAG TPA: hypothetical protein VK203_28135 [Nostocaceae cyanobacterium]|nr:hypothetical protein [Nostocaceae cyanobacterium]
MRIIICPGIHEPSLTESFVAGWQNSTTDSSIEQNREKILIYPGEGLLALSGFHILQFLRDRLADKLESPVVFISFSAGVVGAISAAMGWQLMGGRIKAFIAIDGWAVPLYAHFPIHRLSHDYFTHWSSALLGSGQNNFYAEPPVDHLYIWHSPHMVKGYWVNPSDQFTPPKQFLSAAEFLHLLLQSYEEK